MYDQALTRPSRWGLLRRAIGFALVCSLASGTVFIPGVWAATFFVDADIGDDTRTPEEARHPSTPWKTISRAIGEPSLAAGDDIQVGPGTYDQTLGETFPLTLVDGVAIIGDPAAPDSRVIRAPIGLDVFFNDDTPLADNTILSGLHLSRDASPNYDAMMRFEVGSHAMAPQILANVFASESTSNDDGISIRDSAPSERSFSGLISGNSFTGLDEGVRIRLSYTGALADFSPTIQANTFTGCDFPIAISVVSGFSGVASPEIVDNDATGSNRDIYMYVEVSDGHGPTIAPLIKNNTFSGSSNDSIFVSANTMSLSGSTDTVTFSPTILDNTFTDPVGQGMHFYFEDLEYGNFASDITIAGNTVTNPGNTGIYLEMTLFSSANAMLVDWTISNNTITFGDAGAYYGIEIEATDYLNYLQGDHLNLTVAGNTITGALDGINISLTEFSSTELDLSMTIQGNTITDADDDGIYLVASYQTSFTDSDIDIFDNVIDHNVGDGLVLHTAGFPSMTSYVEASCNTITSNGANGIWQFRWGWGDTPPDYGGGDLLSPGLNTLTRNGSINGFDFFNGHPDPVAAHNNWWGSTDPATIEDGIWDGNDDPALGVVHYSGFLSSAPTVSATATLVDALEVDLSPSGPSEGDTIRYTATLQGTGDCGCASAVFTAGIPGNGTFIPDSLTASRGILINEDVSTLQPKLIVGLGALEAGETVTISWDVMAGGGCSMTSQATLSCYQLGDVLTDDPDVPGGTDPTTLFLALFCDGFETGDTTGWSNSVP